MSESTKSALFIATAMVAMLLGIAAKAMYDDLTGQAAFVWRNILIPLVVSPLVFGAVYNNTRGLGFLATFLVGFQNGFFWQELQGDVSSAPGSSSLG